MLKLNPVYLFILSVLQFRFWRGTS